MSTRRTRRRSHNPGARARRRLVARAHLAGFLRALPADTPAQVRHALAVDVARYLRGEVDRGFLPRGAYLNEGWMNRHLARSPTLRRNAGRRARRRNPTVFDGGSFYSVRMSAREVDAFRRRWPGSGLPSRAITFEFDKRNGDLVDVRPDSSRFDGPDLAALADDAKAHYEGRATRRRNPWHLLGQGLATGLGFGLATRIMQNRPRRRARSRRR